MKLKLKHRVSKDELKEDRFQEAIEKVAAAYYRDRRRFWVAGGIILIVVVGLILLVQNRRRPTENTQAELMLTDAEVAYVQGDLPRAEQAFKELMRLFPRDYAGVKAHYYLGNIYYLSEQPRPADAEREFRAFLKASAHDPVLSPAAQMGIGNCQELAGNNAQAASSYEAAARRWPKSPLAYEALMAAGRCYRNAGALDKAEALYKELLDREKTQPAGRADDVKIQLAYVQALRNKF